MIDMDIKKAKINIIYEISHVIKIQEDFMCDVPLLSSRNIRFIRIINPCRSCIVPTTHWIQMRHKEAILFPQLSSYQIRERSGNEMTGGVKILLRLLHTTTIN